MFKEFKKTLKSAAGRVAEATGYLGHHTDSVMTIVAFHRIDDTLPEDGLTCSPQKFSEFCKFFRKNFHVVPLSDQIEACRRGTNMGGALSVTFDDGYEDNFRVAAPILKRQNIPATFFVSTGFIGSSVIAPWDEHLEEPPSWMNWLQLRQLVSQGFEVGSHTDRHLNLSTDDPSLIRAELETSKAKLERELGIRASLFAYPFGGPQDISETSRQLVRETGFDCCLSCFGGVNPINSDPYHLRRIPIAQWYRTPHQFAMESMLRGV